MRVVFVLLIFALQVQCFARLVTPQRLLNRPLKLYFTGVGRGKCSDISAPRSGFLTYTPPGNGVSDSRKVTIDGGAIGVQQHRCDEEKDAALVFDEDLNLVKHTTMEGFDDYARRFIGNVDPLSTSTMAAIGKPTKSGAPAPVCGFGDSSSLSIELRGVVIANVTEDYHLHENFLGSEYDIEYAYTYALTEFKLDSDSSAICLYAENVDAHKNHDQHTSSGDSPDSTHDKDSTGGLSKGQIGGIIAGLFGVLLGLGILITGAHCWRKQSSTRGSYHGSNSDVEESDKE